MDSNQFIIDIQTENKYHLKELAKTSLTSNTYNTQTTMKITEITTIKCLCDNIIIKAARINSNISS